MALFGEIVRVSLAKKSGQQVMLSTTKPPSAPHCKVLPPGEFNGKETSTVCLNKVTDTGVQKYVAGCDRGEAIKTMVLLTISYEEVHRFVLVLGPRRVIFTGY